MSESDYRKEESMHLSFSKTALLSAIRYDVFTEAITMRIAFRDQTCVVNDEWSLESVFSWRDSRGGGEFWMNPEHESYPALAIRVSGEVADVHFFPQDGHPGFRGLNGGGLPPSGVTRLVFEGCDPYDGEETPNRFLVPIATAKRIALDFLVRKRMSSAISWFEM